MSGMHPRQRALLATLVGLVLVAVHAGLFSLLLGHCRRDALRIRSDAPAASPTARLEARWPRSLDGRIKTRSSAGADGRGGPGMHRREWGVRYRGGFERWVGKTQLVGPFQDPRAVPCALRVILGQSFLGGVRSLKKPDKGSLPALIAGLVEDEMKGFEQWPLGEFRNVAKLRMRWVAFDDIGSRRRQARIRGLAGDGVEVAGILRTTLVLRFEDGKVPLWLAVVPLVADSGLAVRAHVEAEVDFDSRIYQWISDLFDGDELATKAARNELDRALVGAFGLPPPIDLPDGHRLRFDYCRGEPIAVVTGQYASIPLSLVSERDGDFRPVLLGPARRGAPLAVPRPLEAPVAVEFELDAVNGVLHQLFTSGFLDEKLGEAGLAARFNGDPLVTELLSVRMGRPHLTLPPTVWQSPGGPPDFRLGVEAGLTISDGAETTPARIYGTVGIAFATAASPAPSLVAELTLDELALTCEPEPGLLEPCYGDLVAAFRDRAADVHGLLSEKFTALYSDIVMNRRIDLERASFHIDRSELHTRGAAPTGAIRVDLYGHLHGAD